MLSIVWTHHGANAFGKVFAQQYAAALAVDDFALLVHYVVVAQNVFTRFKVHGFHALLRGFDLLCEHPHFETDLLLHLGGSEPVKRIGHAIAAEPAHELIFKRNVELRAAAVALAARASA
jgi:hypothetical protein